MNRPRLVIAVGVLFGAISGCKQQQPIDVKPPSPIPVRGGDDIETPLVPADALSDVVTELAGKPAEKSVGCLPFVRVDSRTDERMVSQLGMQLAEQVSDRLRKSRKRGSVLSPREMAVRIQDFNSTKSKFTSLEAVKANGLRLGVDFVVLGEIRREDRRLLQGGGAPELLVVDPLALDVFGGNVIRGKQFSLFKDRREHTRAWQLALSPSTWRLREREGAEPSPQPTLDQELKVATRALAKDLLHELPNKAMMQNKIYVPPLDTAAYVKAVAELRAAQTELSKEVQAREETKPPNWETGMTLGGKEFATFQAAEDYVEVLRESFESTESGRVSRDVARLFAEPLIETLGGDKVEVYDITATNVPAPEARRTRHMVECSTGGLTRNVVACSRLRNVGMDFVASLTLTRYDRRFVLRVTLYDLKKMDIVRTTHFPIDERFSDILERKLGGGTP